MCDRRETKRSECPQTSHTFGSRSQTGVTHSLRSPVTSASPCVSPGAIFQAQALGHAQRLGEELVPVVVVGGIRLKERMPRSGCHVGGFIMCHELPWKVSKYRVFIQHAPHCFRDCFRDPFDLLCPVTSSVQVLSGPPDGPTSLPSRWTHSLRKGHPILLLV